MERDKEIYERQIKIADAQIDRLVYDLYGLTEGEIKVVEGCWIRSKWKDMQNVDMLPNLEGMRSIADIPKLWCNRGI